MLFSYFYLLYRNFSGDWQGLDGMVIQKNPDENVNHLPSGTLNGLDVSVEATGDNTTQKK